MAKDESKKTDEAVIPHSEPAGGTGSMEAAQAKDKTPFGRFLKTLGPGLITGASDNDPSGISTYTQAGASLGYKMLWTAPVTLPLMMVVQFICAKIGMVAGNGLARVLRQHYSRWALYPVVGGLLIANTINAGADIAAIAAAFNLLVPIKITYLILPVGLIALALQIWCSYRTIANIFKWLTLTLFAYIIAAFLAKPDWSAVFKATVLPSISFDKNYLTMLVAILGTTISPYLFFWQASEEVEEEISQGRKTRKEREGATDAEIKDAALDVRVGMFFCNVVFFFVIITAGATLNKAGLTNIETATDAAKALEPIAGSAATYLFALGIIGAGFLAVPVLTGSSAYAIAEMLGWRHGLDEKPLRAKKFYAVIAASILVGMLIDFIGIPPIKALFYTAVINGLVAPPLLVVVMLVANNEKVMGERTNSRWENILGWAATAIMFAAAIGLVLTWNS